MDVNVLSHSIERRQNSLQRLPRTEGLITAGKILAVECVGHPLGNGEGASVHIKFQEGSATVEHLPDDLA